MHPLLFLVVACWDPNKQPPDSPEDSDSAPLPDDSGDSGVDVLTPTPGPDLPECTPQSGTGTQVSLSGVVLAPEGAIAGVVVFDSATGLIECVGAACDDSAATRICTEGVISPGLVDAHNHLQYNSLPPWRVDPVYDDRYDWRSDGDYYDYRTAYDAIYDSYDCEIARWAELREVVGGTTHLVPREERLAGLRRDYSEMQAMIFGEYPAWDEILSGLRSLERDINSRPTGEPQPFALPQG